mmetsp:Transcript_10815/g.24735  ORF Transcript_10815/g.24735 Transcript_10815/m.24735 type:complete len:470 (-) Transcript_10815:155-1564(-)
MFLAQKLTALLELDEASAYHSGVTSPDEAATEVRTALSFLWRGQDSRELQVSGLRKLLSVDPRLDAQLATEDVYVHEVVGDQVLQSGGFGAIVRSLTKFSDDPEVSVLGIQIIRQLMMSWTVEGTEQPAAARLEAICKAGAVDALLQVLEKSLENPDVVILNCSTLRTLGRMNELALTADHKKKALALLQEAMLLHEYNEYMQACGCLVLPYIVGVASVEDMKKIMDTVMHSLDIHQHSAQMQFQGWRFLGSLQGPNVENWMIVSVLGQQRLLSMLSRSIVRHDEDAELTTMLRRLMENWLSCAAEQAGSDMHWLHELSDMAATARLQSVLPHMERAMGEEDSDDEGEREDTAEEESGQSHNKLSLLHASRAKIAAMEENWHLSREEAIKCTEVAPKWASGWLRLGVAQDALEEFADALDSLQRALDLEEDSSSRREIQAAMQQVLDHMSGHFSDHQTVRYNARTSIIG